MCPICTLPMDIPIQYVVCGHVVCISCVHKQAPRTNNNNTLPCAECGKTLRNWYLDSRLLRELKQYKINCKYCLTQVEYERINKHLNTACTKFLRKCKYCDVLILVKNMSKHMEDTCEKFPIKCDICNLIFPRGEFKSHTVLHTDTYKCTYCCEEIPIIEFFAHYTKHSLKEVEKYEITDSTMWKIDFEEEKEDPEINWFKFLEQTGKKQPELSYKTIKEMWDARY